MDQDFFGPSKISEQDLKPLFSSSKQTSFWQGLLAIVKYLIFFVAVFIITYLAVNFPAIWTRTNFLWKTKVLKQNPTIKLLQPPSAQSPALAQNISENHLVIPKIEVDAPVVWDVPENKILLRLREGIVHYQGTASPGQIGNVFIVGHSSNYFWDPGKYKKIFALLEKVEKGDQIGLNYQDKNYVYEVSEKLIVKPTAVEVLAPTKEPILSLMTCVPVGTSLRRLVVRAKQIYPTSTGGVQKDSPSPESLIAPL